MKGECGMRLIDADKLYPDCMTKDGKLAISQSQLANAPAVNVKDEIAGAYNEGYMCGNKEAEKVKIKSTKDLINNIAGFDVSGIKPLPEYKDGITDAEQKGGKEE